jgi:16S rRNA (adenine1518-N6/adenine1519-N6)-dimethyltransferase
MPLPLHLRADKRLGQHFLTDPQLLAKIVRAAGPLDHAHVLEVGPGPGGLTQAIIQAAPSHFTAIELDSRFVPHLTSMLPAGFHIIQGDAMRIPLASLLPSPVTIVANLPYNIGTALICQWLLEQSSWTSMVVMLQKEVIDRMVATCGAEYGRLSVLIQWLCTVEKLFEVPAGAFTPPPKVTSAVVRITPKNSVATADIEAMSRLTQAAFSQRRKTLRNSLKAIWPNAEQILESLAIAPTLRPEQLAVDDFVRLMQRCR